MSACAKTRGSDERSREDPAAQLNLDAVDPPRGEDAVLVAVQSTLAAPPGSVEWRARPVALR